MKVQLFGIGTKSESKAITAQRRINCRISIRKEQDKAQYVVVGRFGLTPFVTSLGSNPTRGMWPVNTLSSPLLFVVQMNTLYSINNAGVTSVIGTIGTNAGDVSMADDGKFLVLVDGMNGWVYNMQTPSFTKIVDGNFTLTPSTVTWQDNYFIVTSAGSREFQLSQISPGVDPTVWPAVQINFTGSGAGALRAGKADHSILYLFGDVYTEFWQDTGSPDFPYAAIPSAAAQFGLAAPWSLTSYDNTLAGVLQNTMGGVIVARMSGFNLKKFSDEDTDQIFSAYSNVADARAYGFMIDGHPMYLVNFPSVNTSWMFDGLSNVWTEVQDENGDAFWGDKFANFQGRLLVSDRRNGNIYAIDPTVYADNGSSIPIELISKHIWNDDKYIGISRLHVDFEQGVGLATGQGSDPVVDLQVSQDGGNTFFSVGFASIGKIGEYRKRVVWNSLGAARDWVLKLRITDPVKVVITGATAELTQAPF